MKIDYEYCFDPCSLGLVGMTGPRISDQSREFCFDPCSLGLVGMTLIGKQWRVTDVSVF